MRKLNTTLLLIIKNGKILLAEKKRGFGIGKVNGVGGKQQQGETIEQTMLRETKEEIGVVPTKWKKRGIIDFDEYVKDERILEQMHLYVAEDYLGTLIESDEMKPCWFDVDAVPYERMFPDDRQWLPKILEGNNIKAKFVFDKDFNVISSKVEIINE